MFIRESTSKRKFGPPARYIQLVENKWDKKAKKTVTEVLCNFGRMDRLKEDEIRNIAIKLLSYLEEKPVDLTNEFSIGQSLEWGLLYLLENLWKKLKLDKFFRAELKKHKHQAPVEKAILFIASV